MLVWAVGWPVPLDRFGACLMLPIGESPGYTLGQPAGGWRCDSAGRPRLAPALPVAAPALASRVSGE
jgi:hypothetical protein